MRPLDLQSRSEYLKFQQETMNELRKQRAREYDQEREQAKASQTIIVGTSGPIQNGNVVVNR